MGYQKPVCVASALTQSLVSMSLCCELLALSFYLISFQEQNDGNNSNFPFNSFR